MKELEAHQVVKTEITASTKEQRQRIFKGRIRIKKGHSLFQYNLKTNEISYAEFEETSIAWQRAEQGSNTLKRKVVTKEACIYTTALNFKNATRKFSKLCEMELKPIRVKNQTNA